MTSKIKVVAACGYTQTFDNLQALGGNLDLAGVVAAPLPTSTSNITDDERERLRRLAMPVR